MESLTAAAACIGSVTTPSSCTGGRSRVCQTCGRAGMVKGDGEGKGFDGEVAGLTGVSLPAIKDRIPCRWIVDLRLVCGFPSRWRRGRRSGGGLRD